MTWSATILAQSANSWVSSYLGWIVAGAIVLLGLVLYGGGDLLRLSPGRIRAIASVCFRESIRRRVLWLTPAAVIGIILVSQFQRPLDEQDAVRQVTKFCIFASALLVTMAAIILACTNLPREIDNRVIYTVVTKPTTRLEILLGKLVGFGGITAVILVIMGVFSWGYLHIHEWRVMQSVQSQLSTGGLDPGTEQTLRHYSKAGLLDARDYALPGTTQVYPEYPAPEEGIRYITGPEQELALIPFVLGADALPADAKLKGMIVTLSLPWRQGLLTRDQLQQTVALAEGAQLKVETPSLPSGPGEATEIDVSKLFPAFFRIAFLDSQMEVLVDSNTINGEIPIVAADPTGRKPVDIPISAAVANLLLRQGRIYLRVGGLSPSTRFTVDAKKSALTFVMQDGKRYGARSMPFDKNDAAGITIVGRTNQNGQQIAGDASGKGAVGVISFRDVGSSFARGEDAQFEFRTIVERGGDDIAKQQATTWIDMRLANRKTGQISDPVKIAVETRRLAHFSLPARYTAGGEFDVLIRCLTPEQWIGIRGGSLRMASDDRGFGLNLAKSMFILWLFTLLAIATAIFCSTFVSWPIAFVLTLMILLGHWGVLQLGDLASPGSARQIVTDLFTGAAPAVTETLNRTTEGLGQLLRAFAAVLPDVSKFAAMEDIEQGVSVSMQRLGEALKVLAMFGLPIITLSYVFFRNKEVAP